LAIVSNILPTTGVADYLPEKKVKISRKLRKSAPEIRRFWLGENQQNQETPDQFRRFGNPGSNVMLLGVEYLINMRVRMNQAGVIIISSLLKDYQIVST
jgi:hypothetical protein